MIEGSFKLEASNDFVDLCSNIEFFIKTPFFSVKLCKIDLSNIYSSTDIDWHKVEMIDAFSFKNSA